MLASIVGRLAGGRCRCCGCQLVGIGFQALLHDRRCTSNSPPITIVHLSNSFFVLLVHHIIHRSTRASAWMNRGIMLFWIICSYWLIHVGSRKFEAGERIMRSILFLLSCLNRNDCSSCTHRLRLVTCFIVELYLADTVSRA